MIDVFCVVCNVNSFAIMYIINNLRRLEKDAADFIIKVNYTIKCNR